MPSYQQVIIVGHLGSDPEMAFLPDGTEVAKFSVAVSRKRQDKETTVWFRCAAWRKTAEACKLYLHKGSLVLITGEIGEPKPWQGKDGTWRASLDVSCNEVRFMDTKRDSERDGQRDGAKPAAEEEPIPF